MSLPNPGWSVVFGETPTAAKWSELGANDDALAAGTGLNTNAVTPDKLATNAVTLGYASITTSFTSTTTGSYADITSLTVNVTVPAGGRRVGIIGAGQYMSTSGIAGTLLEFSVFDTTGAIQVGESAGSEPVSTYGVPAHVFASHTPAAGSRSYKLQFRTNQAGTFTLAAAATIAAYIWVGVL